MALAMSARRRAYFTWIDNLFNRVDSARIRKAGADRAAAEYVFRMGGRVALREVAPGGRVTYAWVAAESALPPEDTPLHLAAVSLEDSTVSDIGMRYFAEPLPTLRFLSLRNCGSVRDVGVEQLVRLKLHALDLSGTGVSPAALGSVARIGTLRRLGLADLAAVTSAPDALTRLRQSLPGCQIATNAAQRAELFDPSAVLSQLRAPEDDAPQ